MPNTIAPLIVPLTDEQGEKLRAMCGLTHHPLIYQLTWQDMFRANEAAHRYQIGHGISRAHHTQGREKDYWADMANCAMALTGEIAVASYLNVYWSGASGIGNADVGWRLEVKSTVNTFKDRLILPRGWAHPDMPIVRAHMNPKQPTKVLLCGYCLARDFMLEHFWEEHRNGGGAFYCPNELLQPIENLKQLFYEHGVTCFDHINNEPSVNLNQKFL